MITASSEVLARIEDILGGTCVLRPMSREQREFIAKEVAAANECQSRRQNANKEMLEQFQRRFQR